MHMVAGVNLTLKHAARIVEAHKRCTRAPFHRLCGKSQAEKEASLIPQGMRILPEEERLDMLAMLAKSRAEATEKLLVRLTLAVTELSAVPSLRCM